MKTMFPVFPKAFPIPIIVVQHLSPRSGGKWISILNKSCALEVKEVEEKEKIKAGYIYLAPSNYHLLIENDRTFSLSIAERVSFARPSIDVLFETAATVYQETLIGIVLSGSNHDGTAGLKAIQDCGGLCIVQDPATAASPYMPSSALAAIQADYVLSLEKIIDLLNKIIKPT